MLNSSNIKQTLFVFLSALLTAVFSQGVDAKVRHSGDLHERFKQIDSDQSGSVTLNELLARTDNKIENRFARWDANQDGEVDLEEFASSKHPPRLPAARSPEIASCVSNLKQHNPNLRIPKRLSPESLQEKFNRIDVSKNSSFDLDELKAARNARLSERFFAMDFDGDSEVTLTEFKKAKEIRKASRRAIRSCVKKYRNS